MTWNGGATRRRPRRRAPADPLVVEALLLGLIEPASYEHDVVAQALNEHFIELGQDHVVG